MLKVPRRRQIPPGFEQRPIDEVAADLGLLLVEDRWPWFTCRCPVHDDHDPSFRVNVEDGYFRCFGCGIRGDALELVYQVRVAEDENYSRYDAYLEVRDGEPGLIDGLCVEVPELEAGPRALGEFFAATRGKLSRDEADRLVLEATR